jgi:hypothetical protein
MASITTFTIVSEVDKPYRLYVDSWFEMFPDFEGSDLRAEGSRTLVESELVRHVQCYAREKGLHVGLVE